VGRPDTEQVIEANLARETVEVGTAPRLPPSQAAPSGGSLIPTGATGMTSWWGDNYISSRLTPLSPAFTHAIRHESVHRFISPGMTSLFGYGYRLGLMKAWRYQNRIFCVTLKSCGGLPEREPTERESYDEVFAIRWSRPTTARHPGSSWRRAFTPGCWQGRLLEV
jgi:hypothetical protein